MQLILKWSSKILLFTLLISSSFKAYSQAFTEIAYTFPTFVFTSYVDWGDYNKDGLLDIMQVTNSPKIYLNNGDDTFTPQNSIAFEPLPQGKGKWGDYDNDGDLDLLLIGTFDKLTTIYRNNGDNTFTQQTQNNFTGVRNGDIDWGDYDSDGDLDILITGSNISKVYENFGDNSFQELSGINLGALNYEGNCDWGDYDNDGLLDILLAGAELTKIYKNLGNNNFQELVGTSFETVIQGDATFADLDNNGYLDVILSGILSTGTGLSIYYNNGDQSFTEHSSHNIVGYVNCGLDCGDYDDDGDLDVLIAGQVSGSLFSKVWQNNGDSTFTDQTSINLIGLEDGNVKWVDYDSDGDLDIMLNGKDDADTDYVKIYRNDRVVPNALPSTPDGLSSYWDDDSLFFAWNKSTDITTPAALLKYNLRIGSSSGANDIHTSHALADGTQMTTELASPHSDTSYTIKLPFKEYYWSVQSVDIGNRGSAFASEKTTPLDSIQSFDLEASILSDNSMLVRWNNGNGLRRAVFGRVSSTEMLAYPVDGVIYHAEPNFGLGDKISGTNWYCLYNGLADSTIIYNVNPAVSYDIQVIEYILVANSPEYFRTEGNANPGAFSSSILTAQSGISIFSQRSAAKWADYNNDGYLDILKTGYYAFGNEARIYMNDSSNNFVLQTGIVLTDNSGPAAWGDYNNDGFPDLAISAYFTSDIFTKIFKNNGDNSFTEQTSINLTGVANGSVSWTDWDSDGYLDLLISGSVALDDYKSILYSNNGDNTFSERTDISLTGVRYGSSDWADYDNDGDLDLLLTGKKNLSENIANIYQNDGDTTLTLQSDTILLVTAEGEASWGDYNNDGYPDIAIAGTTTDGGFQSYIFKNNGDKTFSKIAGDFEYIFDGSADWGDYDSDGDLDLLITAFAGLYDFSKVFINEGNDLFSIDNSISLQGQSNGSADWGDYDNDGDLDLLIDNIVYRNNAVMRAGRYDANLAPAVPSGLLATNLPGQVKLSWDKVYSDETSEESISYTIRLGTSIDSFTISNGNSDDLGNRLIPQDGSAYLGTSYILKGLESGKYYWGVQAIDQGYQESSWSVTDSFLVKNLQPFFSFDSVCLGLPTTFIDQSTTPDGIDTWLWKFGDGQTSTLQNPTHVFDTSGTYPVTLIVESTGFIDSTQQQVFVKAIPIVDFSADVVCEGFSTNFINTSNNNGLTVDDWYWDFGDGNTSSSQDPSSNYYFNAGDYTVQLIATADNACSDTIQKTVSVAENPVAVITSNSSLDFCSGDSSLLSVGYNEDYEYTWKRGGITITDADSSKYLAKISGDYSVEVLNTLANCSSLADEVSITVLSTPSSPIIIAGGSTQFCQGDSVNLSVTNTSGLYYSWKLNGGAVGDDLNEIEAKTQGSYSLIVSNDDGCEVNSSNTISLIVEQNPAVPTVNVNGVPDFCEGDSVTLAVANNPDFSYQWKNGSNNISDATMSSYSAKATGQYNLVVTNSSGCNSQTEEVFVTVYPSPASPSISSSGSNTFCQGDSVVLSVSNNPELYHQWFLNGGADGDNTYKYAAYSTGEASVEVVNSDGCSATSVNTVNVTVNFSPEEPDVSYEGELSFCIGDSVVFFTDENPLLNFQWKKDGNSISGASLNTFTAKSSGTYQLEVFTDEACINQSEIFTISSVPAPIIPTIQASGNTDLCQGESLSLSVSDNPDLNFYWYLDGGLVGQNQNTIDVVSPGTYDLEIENAGACIVNAANSITVTISPVPTIPSVTLTGSTIICEGESVLLDAADPGEDSYQWFNNENVLDNETGNELQVSITGNYRLRVMNDANCAAFSQEFNITVNDIPNLPLIETENYESGGCLGEEPIRLFIASPESGINYQWKRNGTNIISAVNSSYTGFLDEGDYSVEAINAACIVESEALTIVFADMPEKPEIIAEGPSTWYLACSNDSALEYKWFHEGTLIDGASEYIYIAGQQLGKYEVSVSEGGCFARSDPMWIPLGTGIEQDPFSNIKIYPNPSPGLFTLEMDNAIMGDLTIDIYGESGKKIINISFQKEINHFKTHIDLSGQASGAYFITLSFNEWIATRGLILE